MTVKVEGKTVDIRVATMPTVFGERVTLRLLEQTERTISLEELGVAPEILAQYKKMINMPYGFIPVTGPTGSGKSTTLYASLAAVDRKAKNVITIEDPVEYRIDGVNQIQINTKAGLTCRRFGSILRSDPDIVMVGKSGPETARIAIEAALTGHLVFTTLHTNDAARLKCLTEMGGTVFNGFFGYWDYGAAAYAAALSLLQGRILPAGDGCNDRGLSLTGDDEQIAYSGHTAAAVCIAAIPVIQAGSVYMSLTVTEGIQKWPWNDGLRRKLKDWLLRGMITLRQDFL